MSARGIAAVRTVAILGLVVATAGGLRTGTGLARPAARLASTGIGFEAPDVGPLYPGVTQRLNVVISNPFDHPVTLESLSVTVDAATSGVPEPGCNGQANVVVTQDLATPRATLVVPAHTSRSVADLGVPEDQWPAVQMLNLESNQDACKGAVLSLTCQGSAGSAAVR